MEKEQTAAQSAGLIYGLNDRPRHSSKKVWV